MSKENIKKRGIGWFVNNNNQDQLTQDSMDQQEEIDDINENDQMVNIDDHMQTGTQNNNQMFSKDNQDKVVLDLIISYENIIKDRQLILYKNKGLSEQLYVANEAKSRIKQDLMKKEQLLLEKNKGIRDLENNLTNKQMSYDQLLEDYKEYQNTSNKEYEKISNQLEIQINKYDKLNEESMNTQYQNMLKINEHEERIRILEIENQRYAQQYIKISDEKSELMQTINDFTERMSFSFSPKTSSSTSSDSE